VKILITGGAGFIGSHLCERFLTQGHSVVCVDNFITGQESNVAPFKSDPRFTLIRHDICQPLAPSQPVDYVLHFASCASPPDYLKYPIETLLVGSLGTLHTLEMARELHARFLLASTSEVYGDPLVHPQPESYWGNVNPIGPRGVYDEAKRFSEALTMATHRTHGLDTRIVRIFNTFGPRMRVEDGRAIPNFITQALTGNPLTVYGDGSQTRSFSYITDLVDGIEKLMASDVHEPVNLGNPHEISLLQLAQEVLRLTGSRSPVHFLPLPTPEDPKLRRPEIARARASLHWQPGVALEDGLKRTIEWFRANVSSIKSD